MLEEVDTAFREARVQEFFAALVPVWIEGHAEGVRDSQFVGIGVLVEGGVLTIDAVFISPLA